MIGRRGMALAAAGVGMVLTFGACTDGDPPPTTTSTSTVAPTTTSAKPAPPTLPAAAKASTTKGAAEFFRHFIDLYNYGYRELDNQPLLAVSAQECDFCQGAAKNISGGASKGYTNIGGTLTVTTAVAAPGDPNKGLIVNAVVDQAAGRTEDSTGKTIASIKAERNIRFDARVVWIQDHWRVVAGRVQLGGGQ